MSQKNNKFYLILSSKFLEQPPEPLSLRLSSNLMIGVTRIYGQQWIAYSTEVNALYSNLSHLNDKKAASVDMQQSKAVAEDITLAKTANIDFNDQDPALALLDFENFNLKLDFPQTPEQLRNSMASATSKSRDSKSIDIARGIGSLGRSTSLGSLDNIPNINQFGANDDDMAHFGFAGGDFDRFIPSGPDSIGDIISFKHSSGVETIKPESAVAFDEVPNVIEVMAKAPRRTNKNRLQKLVDEETTLTKEQLLLDEGEDLLGAEPHRKLKSGEFIMVIQRSAISTIPCDLFKIRAGQKEIPQRQLRAAQSSSTVHSDHVQLIYSVPYRLPSLSQLWTMTTALHITWPKSAQIPVLFLLLKKGSSLVQLYPINTQKQL